MPQYPHKPNPTETSTRSRFPKKRVWHDSAIFVRAGVNVEAILRNTLQPHFSSPMSNLSPALSSTSAHDSRLRRLAKSIAKRFERLIRPLAARWCVYLSHQIVEDLNQRLEERFQREAYLRERRLDQLEENLLARLQHMQEILEAHVKTPPPLKKGFF